MRVRTCYTQASAVGRVAKRSSAARRYSCMRWTPRGRPVVYTSQSISLAVLEYALNYKRHGWLPAAVLARATIPDDVTVESVAAAALPESWRDRDPPQALRDIGEDWLRRARTACLQVPSAIVPQESNYLLNPAHPHFDKLTIGAVEPFNFDRRLERARKSGIRTPIRPLGKLVAWPPMPSQYSSKKVRAAAMQ